MHFTDATGTSCPDYQKDVKVAKNYLNEQEIKELNRIVTMWLDFAEDQAVHKKQFFYEIGWKSETGFCNIMNVQCCKVLENQQNRGKIKSVGRIHAFSDIPTCNQRTTRRKRYCRTGQIKKKTATLPHFFLKVRCFFAIKIISLIGKKLFMKTKYVIF
ncbi:RhuM family protein [Histophilus somni]|uniref:RhuM family protein n=1 Tax=Histophilus somni TaxID=731 RepID=UPI0034CFEACF